MARVNQEQWKRNQARLKPGTARSIHCRTIANDLIAIKEHHKTQIEILDTHFTIEIETTHKN